MQAANSKASLLLRCSIFVIFQPKPYSFTYGVKDYDSGTDFSRAEERSGEVTKGEYRTALPDGRIQIVSYVADHNGYKATVSYEGEPTYPPPGPKPTYKIPNNVFAVFADFDSKHEPLPPVDVKPSYHPAPPPPLPPAPKPKYVPPPPPPKPKYAPPPPKPKYQKFRHSSRVVDPFIEPYTKNGRVVGLDYDYYDYNDIYSSSKPTPRPTYAPYKPPPPTPTPKPVYESYKPPPPKTYHPVNAYNPAPVVTTPIPVPLVTTTHASYAPPPPTPTYANAYSPSPSYTAPHPTLHPINLPPSPSPFSFRGLNFRNLPSPEESTFRGAKKREIPGSKNKKTKLPTYPNFKPVYTTASSLLDYDYNSDYDDYKEDSVTLPSRQNTVTATTARPQITSTTTPTSYPSTTPSSAYTTSASPTQRVTPSARGLLNEPDVVNIFTKTTTPPYTTNKLYITTPKPYYGGPWSPNYVEKNYDHDLKSSPSQVTPSSLNLKSSKSSKITTYRPNGFTPNSLKYKSKTKNNNIPVAKSSKYSSSNSNFGSNTSSSFTDQSDAAIDYYDYYYDAALDYLQGRITQLNSKNNKSNNKHTNKRYNKHKSSAKSKSKSIWNQRHKY